MKYPRPLSKAEKAAIYSRIDQIEKRGERAYANALAAEFNVTRQQAAAFIAWTHMR
jgi:hypothetical protein